MQAVAAWNFSQDEAERSLQIKAPRVLCDLCILHHPAISHSGTELNITFAGPRRFHLLTRYFQAEMTAEKSTQASIRMDLEATGSLTKLLDVVYAWHISTLAQFLAGG